MKFRKLLLTLVTLIITISYTNVKAENNYQLSTNIYKTIISDPESIVQSGGGYKYHYTGKVCFYIYQKMSIRFGLPGKVVPTLIYGLLESV